MTAENYIAYLTTRICFLNNRIDYIYRRQRRTASGRFFAVCLSKGKPSHLSSSVYVFGTGGNTQHWQSFFISCNGFVAAIWCSPKERTRPFHFGSGCFAPDRILCRTICRAMLSRLFVVCLPGGNSACLSLSRSLIWKLSKP